MRKEVEERYKSTDTLFYGTRPCGNYVVKISYRTKSNPKWNFKEYYCYLTKKPYDHQPNLNERTLESETPDGDETLPEEFTTDAGTRDDRSDSTATL